MEATSPRRVPGRGQLQPRQLFLVKVVSGDLKVSHGVVHHNLRYLVLISDIVSLLHLVDESHLIGLQNDLVRFFVRKRSRPPSVGGIRLSQQRWWRCP